MYIDTHAHLLFPDFKKDLEEVLNRALENDVAYIVNVGINLMDSIRSVALVEKYDNLFTSVGIHPNELTESSLDEIKTISELLRHPKVVAIGEVGLDYYRNRTPKDLQKEVFARFIELSKESGKPLIIHTRNAWDETETIILSKGKGTTGVFHCFSGSLSNGINLVNAGFYVSYTGNITYKNFRKDEIIKQIPLGKVMIETDSPFLTPEPFRGRRNEPAHVVNVAEKLSNLFDMHTEDVGRITSYNAYRLFGIGEETAVSRIVYRIKDTLYINVTNECSCKCVFCDRTSEPVINGYNLELDTEPTVEETIQALQDYSNYTEIVFCGYGEPTMRLEFVKQVAQRLKAKNTVPLRMNTNGHGSLINGRNIVPELKGLIDRISVSLNAENSTRYLELTNSTFQEKSYDAVLEFIKECAVNGIDVTATVVDYDGVNIEECRSRARELGAHFRIRDFKRLTL